MRAAGIAPPLLLAIPAVLSACREITPAPALESVAVTTVTTGPDQDEAYVLMVAGVSIDTVAANGTFAVTGVPVGVARVGIHDASANCTVEGSNPRDVVVSVNAQSETTFEVSCVGGGTLYVSTATVGPDQDDGYVVSLDGEPEREIGGNALIILPALISGSRLLGLDGVAPNCWVEGDNPRVVSVPVAVLTTANFGVRCVGLGAIEVTTRTSGFDLDSDGYGVLIDGEPVGTVETNTTRTFPEIATGTRSVRLRGVARNCTAEGSEVVMLSVGAGAATRVAFDLLCRAAPIVFARTSDGNRGIYVMNADGTDERRLTVNPFGSADFDIQPDWSPDGARIAFASNRGGNWDIYVMNADGSDPTNLTANPANDQHPAWSPDGSRIAFQSDRSGSDRIHTMQPDGSDLIQLTHGSFDQSPAWSPDGKSLAFVSSGDGGFGLYVMSVPSAAARRLSSPSWRVSGRPSWSPEGSEIAFSSDAGGGWFQVFVITADGRSLRQLTAAESASHSPTWSPDGTKIAFVALRDGPGTIYIMVTDGTNQLRLGPKALGDEFPAWRW